MHYTFKDVLRVTAPLMLSSLSTFLMLAIDRTILAFYSIESMNAVFISSHLVASLTMFFIGITGTTNILVGQLNGAKKFDELAKPVWQMVYLSLMSSIFFIIIAFFSE